MGLTPWVCQTLRVLVASLTPTGSDTARSFTADGEHTLLYLAASGYHHPQEELQLLILVTVAPHNSLHSLSV